MEGTKEEKKTLKILSIDGGGIKGLYSATILAEYEKLCDCRIGEHFDIVCGTSTGGIIALAIALHKPMEQVCDFYEKYGPLIFREKRKSWLSRMGKVGSFMITFEQLFKGLYKQDELRNALSSFFKESIIEDCKCEICIPSYNVTLGEPCVFKRDHKHDSCLNRDNRKKCVDVALATAAAPTYFPLATINNEQHADGGLYANNPALCGIIEAYRYLVGEGRPYDSIELLSIESLVLSNGQIPSSKSERGFYHWKESLFDAMNHGQSFHTHFFLNHVGKALNIKYHRIESENVSPDHVPFVALDNASKKSLMLYTSLGQKKVGLLKQKNPEITELFITPKSLAI